jgi:hypothetical protein
VNPDLKPGIIVMFSGFAGLVLAAIEKVLYDEGVIVNDFATVSGGLPAIMTITVVLFLLVGVVIGMVKA